jgi:magnesium transporter
MITNRPFKDQTWIDISSPSKNELDLLIIDHKLDPLVVKDLLTPTPKQHARVFDQGIYAVLHIPFFRHNHNEDPKQEIDFIITKDNLFTTRYDSIDALHHFAKQVEVNEILRKNEKSHLFFGLMKVVYSFLFDEVEYLRDWLKETEIKIFAGHEKAMVFTISLISRNILNFKRIIRSHELVLLSIKEDAGDIFDANFKREIDVLLEDWQRIMDELTNLSDTVSELRATNDSILSTKQNDTTKQLNAIGSIILPISIIGQIFGLSVLYFPLKNNPYAFWIILGLMFLTMLSSLIYARFKKWI